MEMTPALLPQKGYLKEYCSILSGDYQAIIYRQSSVRITLSKISSNYRKDAEPFISCFHGLTNNTSFQYLSIHAMSVIACYNYMSTQTYLDIIHDSRLASEYLNRSLPESSPVLDEPQVQTILFNYLRSPTKVVNNRTQLAKVFR